MYQNRSNWIREVLACVLIASFVTLVLGTGMTCAFAEQPDGAERSGLESAAQNDQEGVVFFVAGGEEQMASDWTRITPETTALESGRYLVDGDTAVEGDLEVSGEVDLIIGHALRVNGSIRVPAGATLRIYLEKNGSKDRSWVYGRGSVPCIVNEGTTEIYGATVGVGNVTHGVDNFGTLVMYGGEISDCSQDGVHNEHGSKFQMLGGAIRNNSGCGFAGEGTIFVAGTPVVESNKKGDVVLNGRTKQVVFVDGPLEAGARIGVTSSAAGSFTKGYAAHNGSDNPGKYFFAASGDNVTWDADGEAVLENIDDAMPYVDWDGVTRYVAKDKLTDLAAFDGQEITLQSGWYYASKDTKLVNRVRIEGGVHIILTDDVKLTCDGGIHVCEARSITIYGQEKQTGELVCDRSGKKNEAGIGGNNEECGSNITICGGKITAKGGEDAAGIGGGCDGNGGFITIYGGDVYAKGKEYGAGIGGGRDASGGEIMIFGGKVTGDGGQYSGGAGSVTGGGAGIGGGDSGTIGNIQILGGDVTGNGCDYGAGIGGGCENEAGGTITIRNAKVSGIGHWGAGIGGGSYCGYPADVITIEGADVSATSHCGAGIGSGCGGAFFDARDGKKVDIRSSKIYAHSTYGAGIGGGGTKFNNDDNESGAGGAGGFVTIDSVSHIDAASSYGADIGHGYTAGLLGQKGDGDTYYVD